jgi:hypothetical protein
VQELGGHQALPQHSLRAAGCGVGTRCVGGGGVGGGVEGLRASMELEAWLSDNTCECQGAPAARPPAQKHTHTPTPPAPPARAPR